MTGFVSDHPGDAVAGADAVTGVKDFSVLSDTELLAAIAQAGEEALSEIYTRHGSSVYALGRRLCGSESAADVTHEVFLALWNNPNSFDPDRGSLCTHLLSDAHRRAVHISRSAPAKGASDPEEPSQHYDRGSKALALGESGSIRTLLAGLTEPQRSAVILAYFGGYTYQQVADRLRQSAETAKTNIGIGLAHLRAKAVAGRLT